MKRMKTELRLGTTEAGAPPVRTLVAAVQDYLAERAAPTAAETKTEPPARVVWRVPERRFARSA